MRAASAVLLVCSASCSVAQQPPRVVIDTCLAFGPPESSAVAILPLRGRLQDMDTGAQPAYRLFLPDGDNKTWRVGYATAGIEGADYLFVNSHRGYLAQAVSLDAPVPRTVQSLRNASFALLRHEGWRYVCMMEQRSSAGRAPGRSAFVARIPSRMGTDLQLFYASSAHPG